MGSAQEYFSKLAGSTKSDDGHHSLLFLMLALAIHIWDFFAFGFSFGSYLIMMWPYLLLSLFGIFLVFRPDNGKDAGIIFAVSMIALFIPRLLIWTFSSVSFISSDVVGAIVLAAPAWLFYLYFNDDYTSSGVQFVGRIYFLIIIIAAIFQLLPTMSLTTGFSQTGIDADEAQATFLDWIDPRNWGQGVSKWKTNVDRYINQSLRMEYFTGQVEQNKDEPLGVYLEDLRATEPKFYEGSPVVIWANLRGKSFENIISVRTQCYASKRDETIIGSIYPEEPIELIFNDAETLECIFEDENALGVGSHIVKFQSEFNFETWGYVTYTFVDKETIKSYYIQQKNINSELDIPYSALPVYTNGPVSIGINNPDLPISVDLERLTDYDEKNYQGDIVASKKGIRMPSFGVTLANRWPQGEIIKIDEMVIEMPSEFEFSECTPMFTSKSAGNDALTNYTFNLASPGDFYTSITCRTYLKEDAADLFLNTPKVVKTFAVRANYKYKLIEDLRVTVQ